MNYYVREACEKDLSGLVTLYTFLNSNTVTENLPKASEILQRMLSSGNIHLLVADCSGTIAATVTVTIIDSLTHSLRPYALVEHVVTHPDFRRQGMSGALLSYAEKLAESKSCYKLMLITGQQSETVHRLYQKAGYKSEGKTAYVKILEGSR